MTDAITILRIEREDGSGPFQNVAATDAMQVAMNDPDGDWHDELPSSAEAFGFRITDMVCGTETARELIAWFPAPMRDVLSLHGYGLSVYRVPAADVRRAPGAMQVLFDRRHATCERRTIDPRPERRMHRQRRYDAENARRAPCPAPMTALPA